MYIFHKLFLGKTQFFPFNDAGSIFSSKARSLYCLEGRVISAVAAYCVPEVVSSSLLCFMHMYQE